MCLTIVEDIELGEPEKELEVRVLRSSVGLFIRCIGYHYT